MYRRLAAAALVMLAGCGSESADSPPSTSTSTTIAAPTGGLGRNEGETLRRRLHETDLAVSARGALDIDVVNRGPQPADDVRVHVTVDMKTIVRSLPADCTQSAQTITCALGAISARETATRSLRLEGVPASEVRVEDRAGTDSKPEDNVAHF